MKALTLVLMGTLVLGGLGADNLSRDGFEATTLSNGVPVHFKANPNNEVLALQVFLKGGATLLTPETAGYEALALTMLTRGSSKYTYTQLKDLQWRTSSSLTASASTFDGSSFGLVALPGAFDALFDAWSDALLAPRWDPAEFARVLQDAKIGLQQRMQDPYNRAVQSLNDAKFGGHAYAAGFEPTEASLAGATVEKVKAWWATNLKSGRLTVVAVGNFDYPALKARLESTLGKVARTEFRSTEVRPWTTAERAVVVPFADAGAVGYVRADFAIPAVNQADAEALNLGFTVLNDILFDVVRAKYGACYSVWARSYPFLAPYGSLVVYKTDQPAKVKVYLEEAVAILAGGKALASQASASAAGKGGIGEAASPQKADYLPLEKVLDFYKAKSINAFYEGQQTNAALAGQMASALLYRGDPRAYLDHSARVKAVTAADVVRVIQTYVQKAPKAWVVLGSPELLGDLTPASFLGQ